MSRFSFHVHIHTFDDGGVLATWTAFGPDRHPDYVRFIGSGTAATREEAEEAAAAYIAERKEHHQS